MTKRASASIVALRAGEGCIVWTLVNMNCDWIENQIRLAVDKVNCGYAVVTSSPDVIYSGHGAGRSRATKQTEKLSSFSDIVVFCEEQEMCANIAPGLLGDHPRIAYNNVETVMSHLPQDTCTKSQLKTRVSYKEGIADHWKKDIINKCASYILEAWSTASDERKLWFDLIVSQGGLEKDEFNKMLKEQDEIYEKMKQIFCLN